MSPTYYSNTQQFCSVPSLLISDLQRISDPMVRRALLEVQNFCNSVASVDGGVGTQTPTLGSALPDAATSTTPTLWSRVSYHNAPAWIPVWT